MKRDEVLKIQKEQGAEKAIDMVIKAKPEGCEDFGYAQMIYELNTKWADEYSPAYEFTKNLIKGGFHTMKDFDIAIQEIAWHTGYDYEYLTDALEHCDEDMPYIERIIDISDIACEHDL